MWDTIWGYGGELVRVMGHLDRNQWFFVFAGVLVIGFVCMRGFGSRNNY
jgi:hypothetical protein